MARPWQSLLVALLVLPMTSNSVANNIKNWSDLPDCGKYCIFSALKYSLTIGCDWLDIACICPNANYALILDRCVNENDKEGCKRDTKQIKSDILDYERYVFCDTANGTLISATATDYTTIGWNGSTETDTNSPSTTSESGDTSDTVSATSSTSTSITTFDSISDSSSASSSISSNYSFGTTTTSLTINSHNNSINTTQSIRLTTSIIIVDATTSAISSPSTTAETNMNFTQGSNEGVQLIGSKRLLSSIMGSTVTLLLFLGAMLILFG